MKLLNCRIFPLETAVAEKAQRDATAVVVDGEGPEAMIEKLLRNPQTDFIHARSVTRGCYTLGIERICK